MNQVFTVRPLLRPTLFRRLFRMAEPENGYIELENLLATRAWQDIHEGHVADSLFAHGLTTIDPTRAKALYIRALAAFVSDEAISDQEAADLLRLRDLLGLRDDLVEEAVQEVVHSRYARHVREVLRDGHLDEAEKSRLAHLRKALRLDERQALAIYENAAVPILAQRQRDAVRDHRLTDDERLALEAMARNLGVPLEIDRATRAQLDRFHWFWQIERGSFPQIDVPVHLQRGEICHFAAPAASYELRTETHRTYTSGVSVRLRIMKGLYYRASSTRVERVTYDVLRHVDTGTLFVTSKRVIFDGSRKNSVIRLGNILSVIPYSDGIEIEKTSGRNLIFTVSDAELLTVLLTSRLAHLS